MKNLSPAICPRLPLSMALFVMGAIFMFVPSESCAWGPIGHRVAARIAEDHLTPQARAAVEALVGHGVRLADIANWADEQREIAGAGAWHYVNVPIAESRYDRRYCSAQGCVVSKIEDFRGILKDPGAGKEQKKMALRFLIHFIADLHQPLHVGDDDDRGGNLLQVQFFGQGSNLHQVWDSGIIERHTRNENVWMWDVTFAASPRKVAEWSKGNPEEWATESLVLSKSVRRLPGTLERIKSGTIISPKYYTGSLPTIQMQLARAGARTAWVLNEIFRSQ
jgi:hypothetical protein